MRKEKFKSKDIEFEEILKYVLLAAAIVAGAMLCVCHASCKLTSQGIQTLGAEECPRVKGVSVLNSTTIRVDFTKSVSAEEGLVSKLPEGQTASLDAIAQDSIRARADSCDNGKTAIYFLEQAAAIGERYQLYSQIKDSRGNSLTFSIPFDGYNDKIPACAFIEVQPESRSATKTSAAESPYVIIQALQEGNLFGIELRCGQNDAVFRLPAVKAKAGEKIALHLKKTGDEEACVTELGANLALAKTARSSDKWRDIFFDPGSKGISASNDAIFLLDRNTNTIMDALTYYTVKNGKITWKLSDKIQLAVAQKAWLGPATVEGAVQKTSSKVKPLVRKNNPQAQGSRPASKDDWKMADKSVY